MTRIRKWLSSVLVGLSVLSIGAQAEARTVRVSRIPQGRLSLLPNHDAFPKQVAARSKVDGIFPAKPPRAYRSPGSAMAFLAPTKAMAQQFSREGWVGNEQNQSQACLTVVAAHSARHGNSDDLMTQQSGVQQIWAETRSNVDRVWLVRSERLVRGPDDAATLLVTDAWVDAISLGAKLVGTSTVDLQRVAAGPRGIEVYAAREGDKIHFVVTAADPGELPEDRRDLVRSMRVGTTEDSGFSQCGFLRTSIRADGGGRAATVFAPVALRVEEMEVAFDSPFREPDAPVHKTTVREVVTRGATVHLSVSRTSADRSPVVSVGFGWSPDEERFRF